MAAKTKPTTVSLVAVYGSLRKGLHNHNTIKEANHIGDGIVRGFGMYALGLYPALSREGKKTDVVVEVYDVTPKIMGDLDILEGFPSYYTRKLVPVHMNGEQKVAWIYFMNSPLNDPFVECGDWKKYVGSK